MATKILSNDFMHQTAVSEAWKELSENFSWSEALLEKYQDQVDWHEISCNSNVVWTVPMVQKFKNRIDWNKFSEYASEAVMTEPFLDAFKEKWNWSELSDNRNLTMTHELLEKYGKVAVIDAVNHAVAPKHPLIKKLSEVSADSRPTLVFIAFCRLTVS